MVVRGTSSICLLGFTVRSGGGPTKWLCVWFRHDQSMWMEDQTENPKRVVLIEGCGEIYLPRPWTIKGSTGIVWCRVPRGAEAEREQRKSRARDALCLYSILGRGFSVRCRKGRGGCR